MILDEFSFAKELLKNKIIFFGSGQLKWKLICQHIDKCIFQNCLYFTCINEQLSNSLFLQKKFADLAYSEPFYLKEFQTVTSKNAEIIYRIKKRYK